MGKLKLSAGLALCSLLLACGGGSGGAVIGTSDENTSASVGSDLSLTVRVDPDETSGFTAKVGPGGARIALNSGQRLEISADRPASLRIESNGAAVDIAPENGKLWSGTLSSPFKTTVRFWIAPLSRPDNETTLAVDINP